MKRNRRESGATRQATRCFCSLIMRHSPGQALMVAALVVIIPSSRLRRHPLLRLQVIGLVVGVIIVVYEFGGFGGPSNDLSSVPRVQ